jgi:hypothetical protein
MLESMSQTGLEELAQNLAKLPPEVRDAFLQEERMADKRDEESFRKVRMVCLSLLCMFFLGTLSSVLYDANIAVQMKISWSVVSAMFSIALVLQVFRYRFFCRQD